MARGVNKATIVGNLGADPETRYLSDGTAVTTISIATSDEWTDKKTGQKQSRTEWHRVVFWSRLAEVAGEYLRKGLQVYVEGKILTRKWTDQNGVDRYTTEIRANELQMLGPKPDDAAPRQASRSGPAPTPAAAQGAHPSHGFDDLNDDIPF